MAEPELKGTLQKWAEDAFESDGHFVLEVEVKGFTGSRVITIYLDGDEGISLEECGRISRHVSGMLEEEDIVAGKFDLRVSSPGAERSLMIPRQFPQHVGRDVQVVLETEEKFKGKLIKSDDLEIQLETKKGVKSLAHQNIVSAKIVHPW